MIKQLFKEKEIQTRLKELARSISSEYKEVTLLITLTGGVYTGIDLSKYLTIPCKLHFAKVSSYGNEQNNGIIELKWMSVEKGTDLGNVIIIDDICDTGNTLTYLIKYLKNNYKYNEIKTLTLLDKPSRRKVDIKVDYIGFRINDLFVYGYGLDNKGYSRNCTTIYHIEGEEEMTKVTQEKEKLINIITPEYVPNFKFNQDPSGSVWSCGRLHSIHKNKRGYSLVLDSTLNEGQTGFQQIFTIFDTEAAGILNVKKGELINFQYKKMTGNPNYYKITLWTRAISKVKKETKLSITRNLPKNSSSSMKGLITNINNTRANGLKKNNEIAACLKGAVGIKHNVWLFVDKSVKNSDLLQRGRKVSLEVEPRIVSNQSAYSHVLVNVKEIKEIL